MWNRIHATWNGIHITCGGIHITCTILVHVMWIPPHVMWIPFHVGDKGHRGLHLRHRFPGLRAQFLLRPASLCPDSQHCSNDEMSNVQNFWSQYVLVRSNLGDKWMFVSCVDNVLGLYHSVLCQPCGRPCDVIRPTLTNEKLSSWPDDITRSTTRPTQ